MIKLKTQVHQTKTTQPKLIHNSVKKYRQLIRILLYLLIITSMSGCSLFNKNSKDQPLVTEESESPAILGLSDTELEEILSASFDGEPRVIELEPSPGEELPVSGEISITFDRPMDQKSSGKLLELIDWEGNGIAGEVEWTGKETIRYIPRKNLEKGSQYSLIITKQLKDVEGNSLFEDQVYEYQTIGALSVSQVFPANESKDVANNAVITVIFNRPVVPLTSVGEQKKFASPLTITPDIPGQGEWINTSVFAYRPKGFLKGNQEYVIKVSADLSNATGELSLDEEYEWKFSTIAPSIARLRLGNGVTNPANGYKNVFLDEYFAVDFFQPMNTSSVIQALSLFDASGSRKEFLYRWNDLKTELVITPTERLILEEGYTFSIDERALAQDGGKLATGLEWQFQTLPQPEILFTNPMDGSKQKQFSQEFVVKFASPMLFETVKKNIQISPTPDQPIEWWYNDWDWSVHTYSLEPSTDYAVRFLPGMTDIYGNVIDTETRVRFTTTAYTPQAYFQMPYFPSLFRYDDSGVNQEFYVSYRNISSASFQLYRLKNEEFVALQTGEISQWTYTPREVDLVWEYQEKNPASYNQRLLRKITIKNRDGSFLQPGFYFLGLKAPEIATTNPFVDTRLLMVTNTNITFKSTSSQIVTWVTDLTTGEPLDGIQLLIYDKEYRLIGDGKTGREGVLDIEVPAPADPHDIRYVITKDEKYLGFSISTWGSGASFYDYGIWSAYYTPAEQARVYLYTDRPIYRPDQPVYFKGILRLDRDVNYSISQAKEIKVTIRGYEDVVWEKTLPLSEFGSFSGEFQLDKDATLGYYSIEASYPSENISLGNVGFSVAEYRKPEFWLDINVNPEEVLDGDKVISQLLAEYYSGGVVGNADAWWTLTANPFYYSPSEDYQSYTFIDYEDDIYVYTDYDQPAIELVAEGQATLNDLGKLSIPITTTLKDKRYDKIFTIEASVTDIAGNIVSNRGSVIVHRSMAYVGIRSMDYLARAGRGTTIEVVSLDWGSKPIAGQQVNIEILERRWHNIQEQDAQGKVHWTSSVEEIPISTIENIVCDDEGRASIDFVPPNGGIYKARVSTRDSFNNLSSASTFLWVAGDEYVSWRQNNDRSLVLISDQKEYAPGDSASILIASPYQGEAYALITIERGGILDYDVILLKNNSTIYQLPITQDMIPNFYLSVVVIKGVDQTNPRPDFKIGVLDLKINTDDRKINIQVATDTNKAQPGDQVTYSLIAQDLDGNPVDAEFSVGVSDLASLSLVDPNSQPIVDFFYNYRSLNVWTSIPIVMSIEDYNALISEDLAQGEGMGSGGGKGGGDLGVIGVRQEFPDTAYWNASVRTGDDGKADFVVTLPDNLTTWRLDARAATLDTKVGQTIYDIVSSKPLLVKPQTPRFFVAGDEVQIGSAIHNNTNQDLEVEVSLTATGVSIIDGINPLKIAISANRQAYVAWIVKVEPDVDRVDFIFSAEAGDYKDASRPTINGKGDQGIPVYKYHAIETNGTSGMLSAQGSIVETVNLPANKLYSSGVLTIETAPSLVAEISSGLTYLEEFTYECVEQTVSRFLPNVITYRMMKSAGFSDPILEKKLDTLVNTTLQRLANWQNPDGGWGWWSGQNSDLNTSAYVVLGMVEAKKAGFSVNNENIERGVSYLQKSILPLSKLEKSYLLNRQMFVIYVLARADKLAPSQISKLFEKRLNMSIYAQAFLVEAIFKVNPNDSRINTILSDLNSAAILSSTGAHWQEKNRDFWNWNTDTRTTAIVLSTLSVIDPKNPLNANAIRWLMNHKTEGRWRGTQETAWTLMAITNWIDTSGELDSDYQYAVLLNNNSLGEKQVSQQNVSEIMSFVVNVADLLKDEPNPIAFIRTKGEGTLYYSAFLTLALPVNEIEPLNRGIILSRNYYHMDDLDNPIASANWGELLLARLTVVAPNDLHYLVIDDHLPAGLEPVDQSLLTSVQEGIPINLGFNDLKRNGWGWWYFNHVEFRDEKVVLSVDYLPAGTYEYTYLVRAVAPGKFQVIPPVGYEFYFPDVYGRGSGSEFIIMP